MTREIILETLEKHIISNQTAYVVLFNGVRLQMKSGKMSWATRGHARSALINSLKDSTYDFRRTVPNSQELDNVLKGLEIEGIVEFRELK